MSITGGRTDGQVAGGRWADKNCFDMLWLDICLQPSRPAAAPIQTFSGSVGHMSRQAVSPI